VTERNTKVLVAARLTVAERSALGKLAEANDRPVSREVRRAILHYLRQEEHDGQEGP
jgi:predicted transcriptional regulator